MKKSRKKSPTPWLPKAPGHPREASYRATLPGATNDAEFAHLLLVLQALLFALKHAVNASHELHPTTETTLKRRERTFHAFRVHVLHRMAQRIDEMCHNPQAHGTDGGGRRRHVAPHIGIDKPGRSAQNSDATSPPEGLRNEPTRHNAADRPRDAAGSPSLHDASALSP